MDSSLSESNETRLDLGETVHLLQIFCAVKPKNEETVNWLAGRWDDDDDLDDSDHPCEFVTVKKDCPEEYDELGWNVALSEFRGEDHVKEIFIYLLRRTSERHEAGWSYELGDIDHLKFRLVPVPTEQFLALANDDKSEASHYLSLNVGFANYAISDMDSWELMGGGSEELGIICHLWNFGD